MPQQPAYDSDASFVPGQDSDAYDSACDSDTYLLPDEEGGDNTAFYANSDARDSAVFCFPDQERDDDAFNDDDFDIEPPQQQASLSKKGNLRRAEFILSE
jgi:hypothetical protein